MTLGARVPPSVTLGVGRRPPLPASSGPLSSAFPCRRYLALCFGEVRIRLDLQKPPDPQPPPTPLPPAPADGAPDEAVSLGPSLLQLLSQVRPGSLGVLLPLPLPWQTLPTSSLPSLPPPSSAPSTWTQST